MPRVDISWQPAHHSAGGGEMDRQSHNPAWRETENLKTFPAQWTRQPHAVRSADSCTVRASHPMGPVGRRDEQVHWEATDTSSALVTDTNALRSRPGTETRALGRTVLPRPVLIAGGTCLLILCRLLLCGNTHLRRCILLFPKEETFWFKI